MDLTKAVKETYKKRASLHQRGNLYLPVRAGEKGSKGEGNRC